MENFQAKSAAELISLIISPEVAKAASEWARFSEAWKAAAGEREAAHSRVVDLRNGVLVVEAEHPGWIQLLQLKQAKILSSVQKRYPELKIKALAFKLKQTVWVPEDIAAKPESPEQDEDAEADIPISLATVDQIKDENLKNAISHLMSAIRTGA